MAAVGTRAASDGRSGYWRPDVVEFRMVDEEVLVVRLAATIENSNIRCSGQRIGYFFSTHVIGRD